MTLTFFHVNQPGNEGYQGWLEIRNPKKWLRPKFWRKNFRNMKRDPNLATNGTFHFFWLALIRFSILFGLKAAKLCSLISKSRFPITWDDFFNDENMSQLEFLIWSPRLNFQGTSKFLGLFEKLRLNEIERCSIVFCGDNCEVSLRVSFFSR